MLTLERSVQPIEGAATRGCILPVLDIISVVDGGHNSKDKIDFLKEKISATGIGTHQKSLEYTFVYCDGPMSKRHKVMYVMT